MGEVEFVCLVLRFHSIEKKLKKVYPTAEAQKNKVFDQAKLNIQICSYY